MIPMIQMMGGFLQPEQFKIEQDSLVVKINMYTIMLSVVVLNMFEGVTVWGTAAYWNKIHTGAYMYHNKIKPV